MCGISGGSAKKGFRLDLKKLMILGLFNVQRGTDSCGYYYAGNIDKGVDDLKVFGDFITKRPITKGELDCEVFICHTRKSTVGKNTFENAHPYIVNNYVQAHNGTIKNIYQLTRRREISSLDFDVDSQGLALIIEREGFKVLEEYEGGAALAITYTNDPNTLYLYHGASKDKPDGELLEERPLYYLITEEGLYFSSLKSSLLFIANEGETVQCLPYNKVYKITEGAFNGVVHEVKREEANVVHPVIITHYPAKKNDGNTGGIIKNFTDFFPVANTLPFDEELGKIENPYIYNETMPFNIGKNDLYYRYCRFFTKEHKLLNGKYRIDSRGKILEDGEHSDVIVAECWFVRGALMKSEQTYKEFVTEYPDIDINMKYNFAKIASVYAEYPLVNLKTEGILNGNYYTRYFYRNGKKIESFVFQPPYAHRKYTLKKGCLEKIKPDDKNDLPLNSGKANTDFDFKLDRAVEKNKLNFVRIVRGIYNIAQAKLTEKMIMNLPEFFFMFIDYYIASQPENEKATNKEIEAMTTILLRDLVKSERNLREYLHELKDEKFMAVSNIQKALEGFDPNDIADLSNRYEFMNFNEPEPAEKDYQKLLQLEQELEALEVFIDDLKTGDPHDPLVHNYLMETEDKKDYVEKQIALLRK